MCAPMGVLLQQRRRPEGTAPMPSARSRGRPVPGGTAYVEQELTDPRRTIATSVPVKGGELPLASVRLTAPIPKGEIFAAMEAMKRCVLTAPVEAGTVVISHLLGYEADVIVTKSVGEKGRG